MPKDIVTTIAAAPIKRLIIVRAEDGSISVAAEYDLITSDDIVYEHRVLALTVSPEFAAYAAAGWDAGQIQVNAIEYLTEE